MQRNTFTISLLSLIFTLIFSAQSLYAQLEVIGGQTPEQMIENFLGVGVEVDNVVINCPEVAYGTFNGVNSNIGIDNGILLTTGSIDNAVGPNNVSGAQTSNGAPGDLDLGAIVNQITFDACILEFDFVPASNTLTFTYVFGSEEYLEWVEADFNDVFAFFITGPNPSGSLYDNRNIALLPGTDTPVSIDNVNDDLNSEFYVNNGTGDFPIDPTTTVQYDGFTLPLMVEIELVPCETYHLKLAIADSGDEVWDSGVFLEAGSFNTDIVTVTASTSAGTDTTVEGCLDGTFTFTSNFEITEDLVIDFTVSGTAESGSDYVAIPTSITIPAGQTSASIDITTIDDAILEGIENITIDFDLGTGCAGTLQTATLFLSDPSIVGTVSVTSDRICGGGAIEATENGLVLAEGDVFTFIVHNSPTGDVTMGGFTIYAISADGFFENDGGIPQNIPVYISTTIGNNDGSGTGTPDFTDFCLEVSPPAEVVFLTPITFMIDEFCEDATGDYYVSFQLQGGFPEFSNSSSYTLSGDYAGTYGFGQNAIMVIYPAGGGDNVYDFSVVDAIGCTATVVSDVFECAKNPIELLGFDGEVLTTGNLLQWTTASETDNDYFELFRSTDGKTYEPIAVVNSQGNSQNLQSYQFLDRTAPNGLTYYQLTQYDFNGLSTTFPTVALQRGETTHLQIVQVSPVPAKDFVTLSFSAANNKPLQISLYNVAGQVVFSQTLETTSMGIQTLTLDMQSLASGMYLLQIGNDLEWVSQKLVRE
ncbi:MAG: choice-of-anchor L domain-containing protein [Chitinophagales bacterium]